MKNTFTIGQRVHICDSLGFDGKVRIVESINTDGSYNLVVENPLNWLGEIGSSTHAFGRDLIEA